MERIRGMFRVMKVTIEPTYPMPSCSETVLLEAVLGNEPIPEAERYHKATPSGSLEIRIDNPDAQQLLQAGGFYYLDLTPAHGETEKVTKQQQEYVARTKRISKPLEVMEID